jgi:small subunit ribosomal protein S27Ae
MADEKKPQKKSFKAYKGGKMCPKCGVKLGEHADRFSCGRCTYTEFKKR